jgi:hypothetical protein
MEITRPEDLLACSRAQIRSQRLLFVFAAVALPDDPTTAEHVGFACGEGGTLLSQMCVDKAPDRRDTIANLVAKAAQFGKPWGIVFVAAMSRATPALCPAPPMPMRRWSA